MPERMIQWNTEAFERECIGVTMDRLEECANIVAEKAKEILKSKLKGGWPEHGPYKTGKDKEQPWTARERGHSLRQYE